jgi:hypothetical protein
MLVLWLGGSDLAIVIFLSLGGSDLAVVVFQTTYCCCGWEDLIWLLLFSDDVLLLWLGGSDLVVVVLK